MNDSSDQDPDELVFEFNTECEIPPLFYSEETERPFSRCVDCNTELLLPGGSNRDEPVLYQTHKVFVRNEAVFELAICFECQECLRREFSEETAQAIAEYLQEHLTIDPWSRRGSFEECIARCLGCEKPREECYRYSMSGMFGGPSLLLIPGPYILCNDCEVDIAGLISRKTRDAWDRFVDEHFDGPPGVEADDWDRTPMLI